MKAGEKSSWFFSNGLEYWGIPVISCNIDVTIEKILLEYFRQIGRMTIQWETSEEYNIFNLTSEWSISMKIESSLINRNISNTHCSNRNPWY